MIHYPFENGKFLGDEFVHFREGTSLEPSNQGLDVGNDARTRDSK